MSLDRDLRILIVDESAVFRRMLTSKLEGEPGLQVSAAVAGIGFARERMRRNWPDVVVLDLELPDEDSLAFLRTLLSPRPTPVVVTATLSDVGADRARRALGMGAVGLVRKPRSGLRSFLEGDRSEIVRAVKVAAGRAVSPSDGPRKEAPGTDRLIAIGTSVGGTTAVEQVLSQLPRLTPGMVIVQHMPPTFTTAFAARLNLLCPADVIEAQDGDHIQAGRILIAPGGRHLGIERDGNRYRARVWDGPKLNRHRPSVDVLFESVARCAGANALGVIMTGMGDDGARGLLQMRTAGARTIGQDEASCMVYGMPAVAQKLGAVEKELPLTAIAGAIERFATN